MNSSDIFEVNLLSYYKSRCKINFLLRLTMSIKFAIMRNLMIAFKSRLKEKIYSYLKDKYPLDLETFDITYAPQLKMGDLALAFPFQVAKKMKRSPREVAAEMIKEMTSLEGIDKVEVAGPGYINFFLDREHFFSDQLRSLDKTHLFPEEKKIIIEHTNINPNKAAHIGHLRNAVLGDTLGRCLLYKGENVEIQNYIDDTGVQVVDVVFGFMDLEKKGLEEITKIEDKFDYYCWNLYTRVSSYLDSHPEAQARKSEILKKVEEGIDPEAEIANTISRRIIKAHLQTMERLGISYDLLPCENSILKLKFWDKAFSLLKKKNAVTFVEEGLNKGCWVMKLEDAEDKEKIIVRSDKTVTYVGKDIAYQLWKFGLLEQDFYYEPFLDVEGKTIWISSSLPNKRSFSFGQGSLVYNVIDTRQSYLQKVVVQGLRSLKYLEQAEKSIHFSYEMVALSPKSLGELGIQISPEDQGKNFHEVSGRKGMGVKADDLLNKLEAKALEEVEKRNPDIPSRAKRETAHKIAVASLRYFMLKYARNSLIVFDFEEALNFEGETGPYLQYSLVRINSIFRRLKEKTGLEISNIKARISSKNIPLHLLSSTEHDESWGMTLYASRLDEEVLHSIRSLEFSHLAKFSFNLCQRFNAYYHKYSVIAENDEEIRAIRAMFMYYVREVLTKAFSLMGIPIPERM
jgi:arginyl-tRNA synthetase